MTKALEKIRLSLAAGLVGVVLVGALGGSQSAEVVVAAACAAIAGVLL